MSEKGAHEEKNEATKPNFIPCLFFDVREGGEQGSVVGRERQERGGDRGSRRENEGVRRGRGAGRGGGRPEEGPPGGGATVVKKSGEVERAQRRKLSVEEPSDVM